MRKIYHFVYKIQDLVIEQLHRRQNIVLRIKFYYKKVRTFLPARHACPAGYMFRLR